VAEAFVPIPDPKWEVNHIDGNKENNKIQNLEWVSHAVNMRHAFRTGIAHPKQRTNCGHPVTQFTSNGRYRVRDYATISEAARVSGAKQTSIIRCCQQNKVYVFAHYTAAGFAWKYTEDTI
jgi:hypothetical protein